MAPLTTQAKTAPSGADLEAIAAHLMAQPPGTVHTVALKAHAGRPATRIHYVARHADVMAMLRGEPSANLSASHYDHAMASATQGRADFLLGDPGKKHRRWAILRAALDHAPAMDRRDGSDFRPYARSAVREAMRHVQDVRLTSDGAFDGVGDFARIAAALASAHFTGLDLPLPGKPLETRAKRFMLLSQMVFGQGFANLDDRSRLFRWAARFATKRMLKGVAESRRTAREGSLLARLDAVRHRFPDVPDAEYDRESAAMVYEISGTIQILVTASFANMMEAIHHIDMDVETLSERLREDGPYIVDEALRLVPTTPQLYRYVEAPFEFGGTKIAAGDYVCALTGAAGHDPDAFPLPHHFAHVSDPDVPRRVDAYLNFGPNQAEPNAFRPEDSQHPCFGQFWARHLLSEMVHAIAGIENVRVEGDAKRMAGLPSALPMRGPLDIAERTALDRPDTLSQNLYTVLSEIRTPVGADRAALEGEVRDTLTGIGNPCDPTVFERLRDTGLIHFASLTVVPGGTPGEPSYLVLEFSADGPEGPAIDALVGAMGDRMLDAYRLAGAVDRLEELSDHLKDHSIDLAQSPWPDFLSGKRRNGLGFCGTQGLSQRRIRTEAELADQARMLLDDGPWGETPLQALRRVRDSLQARRDEGRLILWPLVGSKPPIFAEDSKSPWVVDASDAEGGSFVGTALKMAPKMFPRPLLPVLGLMLALMFALAYAALGGQSAPACGAGCAPIPPWLFDPAPSAPITEWRLSPGRLLLAIGLAMIVAIAVTAITAGLRRALRSRHSFGFSRMGAVVWFSAAFAATAAAVSLQTAGLIDLAPLRRPDLAPFALPRTVWIGVAVASAGALGFALLRGGLRWQALPFAAIGTVATLSVFALAAHLQWTLFTDALPGRLVNRWADASMGTRLLYPAFLATALLLARRGLTASWRALDTTLPTLVRRLTFGGLLVAIALTSFFTLDEVVQWAGDWRDWGWDWLVLPSLLASVALAAFAWATRAIAGHRAKRTYWFKLGAAGAFAIAAVLNADQWFGPDAARLLAAAALGLLLFIVVAGVLLGLLGGAIRRSETRNRGLNPEPNRDTVAAIMARENKSAVQNHMASVVRLVPSPFRRRITLPLALRIVLEGLANKAYRPGFLGSLGTVQYARWVHLPRTNNYVFYSNYDGSFESYLEDFITKASFGMTGVWSHSVGFPETKFLFFGGSEDGDRFKRYARGSMIPTPFWFSAYPNLSGEQIRRNALIRDGLARIDTASDAAAWVDLFGSSSRPDRVIQDERVQTLMFSGGGKLHFGACLAVIAQGDAFPPQTHDTETPDAFAERQADYRAHAEAFRAWLCEARHAVAYGDRAPTGSATYLALGRKGLARLGLDGDMGSREAWRGCDEHDGDAARVRFPPAFALGMDHASRRDVLGDAGPNAPDGWDWGARATEADAVLLLYAETKDGLDAMIAKARLALREVDPVAASHLVRFEPLGDEKDIEKAAKARCPVTGKAAKAKAEETEDTPEEEQEKETKAKEAKEKSARRKMMREPFGFADGISQPIIEGTYPAHRAPKSSIHRVEPGEFILGYRDNRGFFPPSPEVESVRDPDGRLPAVAADQPLRYPRFADKPGERRRDLGRNGSFLVIRQLEQDVQAFREDTLSLAGEYFPNADPFQAALALQAKMVGRWHDGQSLEQNPVRLFPHPDGGLDLHGVPKAEAKVNADNEFLFAPRDPQGELCPLGSHVRRTFPRDGLDPDNPDSLDIANRHRVLRRGRAYEETVDGKTRKGTFFMCLNADIERQFEFVQQTWIGSPKFHGLTNEIDPISGQGVNRDLIDTPRKGEFSTEDLAFTIQSRGRELRVEGLRSYVTMRGGGYFFLPGRDALEWLCEADRGSGADG